jgi:DNA-binding MarR family transcriptional regulator
MTQQNPKSASRQLDALYERPGFLIRRAHQIAQALFEEEASTVRLTASQFGALTVASARGPIDQIGLARLMGIDQSTAGLVLNNLAESGLILRTPDPNDRRRKLITLTGRGAETLRAAQPAALAVKERILAVFTPDEADEIVRLLKKLVETMNPDVRAPRFGE